MIVTALLGAGAGLGAYLVYRALVPRPVPLATALDELAQPRLSVAALQTQAATSRAQAWERRLGRVGVRLVEALGVDLGHRRQDLHVAGRSVERHALEKLLGSIAGLGSVTIVGLGLRITGSGVPSGVVIVGSAAGIIGGFLLPDWSLRDEVERRRRAFRHALSSYLDLVNVILAGGGGTETALHAAAESGDGWAFAELREALIRARLTSRSTWDALAELGDRMGVSELGELASSVSLAGAQGAKIRGSLATKADTLRGHQIAETESAAEAATEHMTVPVAVLLLGFLVFIAFPAVIQITTVAAGAPGP